MKIILFTGARSGIALDVINKLIDKDYYIYLTVRTENQLKSIEEKYRQYNNIKCLKLDILNIEDILKVKDLKIDILVNNAAIGYSGSIIDLPIEKLKENFDVNVFAYFKLEQLIIKDMIKRNSGKIINISSMAGILPIPFLGGYCATKASITKITECLRLELKTIHSNVKICLIQPGLYHTGFNQVIFGNKYDLIDEKSPFYNIKKSIKKKEEILFKLLERKDLNRIRKKIIKVIEKENPKFITRAPLFQKIGAKLYQIFFG